MTDELLHPTADRLSAYAEGDVADGDRAVLESHMVGCARCQAEVEEWRSLFAGLAALPQLAPSGGFADRVMGRVHIRQPWHARVAALVRRLVPHTTTGWTLAVAFLALPTLVTGGAMTWVFSQPWLSIQGVWLFVQDRAAGALVALGDRTATALVGSDLTLWLVDWANALVSEAGVGGLGAAAAALGTLLAASAWILYQNLIRTPTRDRHYVSYSF